VLGPGAERDELLGRTRSGADHGIADDDEVDQVERAGQVEERLSARGDSNSVDRDHLRIAIDVHERAGSRTPLRLVDDGHVLVGECGDRETVDPRGCGMTGVCACAVRQQSRASDEKRCQRDRGVDVHAATELPVARAAQDGRGDARRKAVCARERQSRVELTWGLHPDRMR
jgi:hypothetical protein